MLHSLQCRESVVHYNEPPPESIRSGLLPYLLSAAELPCSRIHIYIHTNAFVSSLHCLQPLGDTLPGSTKFRS